MPPRIAAALCAIFIVAVFFLNRDRKSKVSLALWLPIIWLSISASRMVSEWFGGIWGTSVASDAFVEGNSLDAAIFAALLVVGSIVLLVRGQRVREIVGSNWPLIVFFTYCLLSVMWSDYPTVAFKRWTKELGDWVMVLVVLTELNPTAAIQRFLWLPGTVLVPVSILLIRYYPNIGRGYSPWTGEAFNNGVATGKNGLGYVCLIFGVGCLWSVLEALSKKASERPLMPLLTRGAILLLTLWLFLMAHSATSLACFLIGGSLMLMMSLKPVARNWGLVTIIVSAVLLVVTYGLLINPNIGLVEAVGRDSTLTGRTTLWNQVLALTVNPFFGAGYESFWLGERLQKMWDVNWEHPNQAHNGYLEVYLDLGWMGLTLLAVVVITGYRNIVRLLRTDPIVGKLRLAFLVIALVYNLTEHAFRELHPVWIAFLLAVTIVPIPRPENSHAPVR